MTRRGGASRMSETDTTWCGCHLAASRHDLRTLRAAAAHENAASQKILTNAGFVPVGPAAPTDLGGKRGTWHERDLARRSF
jgi:ribosomal-protein-alanine N-acetyltransferase